MGLNSTIVLWIEMNFEPLLYDKLIDMNMIVSKKQIKKKFNS